MALPNPDLSDLSPELLCHILQYLPLKTVLSVSMLNKKLSKAVAMHLQLCKCIDFCEDKIYGFMPASITDEHMLALFKKCPQLVTVYGLHPIKVERRSLRKKSALSVSGIVNALSLCRNLRAIETSDLKLLEAILQHLPQLEIIGHFRNRDGVFPLKAAQKLKLMPFSQISSLHLIGVEVPELTSMPTLENLHLHWVRFTKMQPFRPFAAVNLKTFVMKHCKGPLLTVRYLSLIIALSNCRQLSRLELVRIPFPGGLFQRAVEDAQRGQGFANLKTLAISSCKGMMETDLGHLMIVSSKTLETLYIQPSLTRDSLFVSLSFAQCDFPKLHNLHIGYVDKLNFASNWNREGFGVSPVSGEPQDPPSTLTDSGMKVISQLFPHIKSLSVSNCPHIMAMDQWSPVDGEQAWKELTDLSLQRCHCLQLPSFALFLAFLPKVEVVILHDMFREPPKGCSHVGLSAGTGLGMSSAVVSNQDEHIAVQGHQQDFDFMPDEQDNQDLDNDLDIEENPDQHIMVLQQEFFDEENQIPAAAMPVEVPVNNAVFPPENRIRRELNADYRVELGEDDLTSSSDTDDGEMYVDREDEQAVRNVDRDHSYHAVIEYSFSDTDNSDEDSQSPKKSEGARENLKEMPEKKFKGENKEVKPIPCSSSTVENKTSSKGKSTEVKKISAEFKNDCKHCRGCKNHSKHFDPNQPSTSKGGNCFDCTCEDNSDCNGEASTHEPKSSSKRCMKTEGPMLGSSSRAKKLKTKTESDDVLTMIHEHDAESKGLERPLTRQRKRMLDQDYASFKKSLSQRAEYARQDMTLERHEESIPNDISTSNVSVPRDFEESSHDEKDETPPETHTGKCDLKKCSSKCGHVKKASYRNKGPVTRRKMKTLCTRYMFVSEGTQATSADIRKCIRKGRHYKRSKKVSSKSAKKSRKHISAREVSHRPKIKPSSELHDKCTSTSDPLMEDDAVQTLRLVSETLISLTIISCGISDIVIDHCHSMTHVEVQACRILKMFQIHYCPALKRLNIRECPKLTLEAIVPEVVSLVATRNLLLSYEPCLQAYHPTDSEKIIVSKTPIDQSVILFHDLSKYESGSASVKENLLSWMEVIQKMHTNHKTSKGPSMKEKHRQKSQYPYGHVLRRIHGVYQLPKSIEPDQSSPGTFQILTNDHMFTTALETLSWDDGFPAPEIFGKGSESAALLSMMKTGCTEKKLKSRRKITAIYIPVFDYDINS